MAVIDDVIRQGQRSALAGEVTATDLLTADYRRAWTRIERELATIDRQISRARSEARRLARAGNVEGAAELQDMTRAWLRRQRWWQEVQASIATELQRWQGTLETTIAEAQAGAVTSAARTSREMYRITGRPWRGEVYRGAMERWAAARSPGSPLRPIFDRYGAGASSRIEQMITEGLGTGQGSGTIIRRIRRLFVAQSPHLATLVRTETHRAYRGAFHDTMQPLEDDGVVIGYVWLAALSSRTCPACLALHGRRFDYQPGGQHPNCRCVTRPVVDPDLLPGSGYQGPTGEEWLRAQPEAVQAQVFKGMPTHYEAFRDGTPLDGMVTVHRNPVWGDTLGISPVRGVGGPMPDVPVNRPLGRPGSGSNVPVTRPTLTGDQADKVLEPLARDLATTLSDDQINALSEYSGRRFEQINGVLRGDRVADPETLAIIDDLDSVFRTRHPGTALPDDMLLHRGMSWDTTPEWVDRLTPGDRITDPGYLSTTTNDQIVSWFMAKPQKLQMEIIAPSGTSSVYTYGLGLKNTPLTGEVLFPRGTRYEVLEVSVVDGVKRVLARIIGP